MNNRTVIKFILPYLSYLFCISLLQPVAGQAQQKTPFKEAGLPYIQNFIPKHYGAAGQNWAIVEDRRGVLYFGNSTGVLEYDGVSWRLIPTADETVARSLAIDENGQIYVGAQGDFGYLTPNKSGQLHYISLRDSIPPAYRTFNDVWQTYATSHGIYFKSAQYLFRWDHRTKKGNGTAKISADMASSDITLGITERNGRLSLWEAKNRFYYAFKVHDDVYIRQTNIGLMKVDGDTLRLIPGGSRFYQEPIFVMLPFPNTPEENVQGRILVGTRAGALFVYDGQAFHPFPIHPAAEKILQENLLYHGAILADSTFALGTLGAGVVIVDQYGRFLQSISQADGLRNAEVRFVYPGTGDNTSGLWLGLNNGLARVETPSPFSLYPEQLGLKGSVADIVRHRGRIYATTSQGIFSLANASAASPLAAFQPVENIASRSWSLLSADNTLLAATRIGIYRLTGNRATQINNSRSHFLFRSRLFPDRIYVGLSDGLALLTQKGDRWQFAGRFPEIRESVRSIAEEVDGTIWLGTVYQGTVRVKIQSFNRIADDSKLKIDRYSTENGLPKGEIQTSSVKGEVTFATEKGIWRFNSASDSFSPDNTFHLPNSPENASRWTYCVTEDSQGDVWLETGQGSKNEIGLLLPKADGKYAWQQIPFLPLADFSRIFTIYPDEADGKRVIWFGGTDGIVRYDHSMKIKSAAAYQALVRKVTAGGDSTIYGGGNGQIKNRGQTSSSQELPVFSYAFNALRFEYAAPGNAAPSQNRYQVFLEGFDPGWSHWTTETRKDYTNLPEGDYTFRVRARDIHDAVSETGIYAFTILPPWYRSNLAYFFYSLFGLAFFSLIVFSYNRWRTRQLKQRTKELETMVAERTQEVRQQRDQLEMQAEKLQEMDKLKSRFFANISHEFRTPLTLILGPLDKLVERLPDDDSQETLSVVQRNARRLLRLINELLDLAKLESGKMTLDSRAGDFIAFLRGITSAFSSLAEIRNIDFQLSTPENAEEITELKTMLFDHDKLEKVFANILANAFKFTPDNGKINLAVTVSENSEFRIPNSEFNNSVKIMLKDTGSGIPAKDLPYIFDRFYQSRDETTSAKGRLGTGIGMALVKELVELHDGIISLESEIDKGTAVIIQLPLRKGNSEFPEGTGRIPQRDRPNSELKEHKGELSVAEINYQTSELPTGELHNRKSEFRNPNSEIVLVVEDNADMRRYICESLSATDKQLIEAENGQAGFDKAVETIPDLIISDVMMPEMNGYQLSEKLKTDERTSHIPVILLTAKAGEESQIEGLETGADDYLTKPFSVKALRVRVKNLIEQRRRLREKFAKDNILKADFKSLSSMDEVFFERVLTAIKDHMADENFGVAELADVIGLHRMQLHRKLKAITNQSANEILLSVRLEHAAEMLRKHAATIAEIAYSCGFNTPNYFTKVFRKKYDCSPSEYQKRFK